MHIADSGCAAKLLELDGRCLAGCFGGDKETEVITAATNEERVAYLEALGWQVEPQPIETLDLQLPEDLKSQWGDYLKLQEKQGLPFGGCAGQTVRRFTYTVTNYPQRPDGVQLNLYICEDLPVAGDVVCTGTDGFQDTLVFPQQTDAS